MKYKHRLLYVLLVIAIYFLLMPPTSAAAQTRNPQLGVIEAYEAAGAADELGVGWTRVRFPWAEVQPDSAEQWLGVVDDGVIESEIAAGREVVGLLIGMPQWARDAADLPRGLYLDHDDADNLWATYVRTAVSRYQGQITDWIIWNEPDIWDENTPGYSWHGSEADFAQLLKVAYLVAKDVDSETVIHLPAMTFFWDNNFGRTQYLDRLLTEIAKDPQAEANGYYFDVATAHLYFQPNQIFDILAIWQGIMDKHGLGDKAWWLAETNAPVVDDPSWPVESVTFNVTQADQANFIGQGIATALAAGVERVAVFKLIDTQGDRAANPEPFGLLRDDGSARPAFAAYQTVIELFQDITAAQRERWDAVGQVRLDRGDGGVVHVLFARNGADAEVEIAALPNMEATLYDAFGTGKKLVNEDGVYRIKLEGSACHEPVGDTCLIGGLTHFLYQKPVAVAAPTFEPLSWEGGAVADFPNALKFDLAYVADRPITAATLNYQVAKFSCIEVETAVPVEIERDGQLSWTWQMVR
ncbi:MAG TPA: hypothetical protein ENJ56_05690, partial [Anaerolineae bacterium]|nr:hypothetical protein [Anaerolineae bacterium]